MALSPIGTSFDNAFCMPSSALNSRVPALNSNSRTNGNTEGYYAKKGEPMYMQEMDADEDGVVSYDEFKDYCKENGISTRDMMKMMEMGEAYRTLQAQTNKNSNSNSNKSNSINDQVNTLLDRINSKTNDRIYATRGDEKYNEAMDTNGDDKVTYKEYVEYCIEHSKTNETKSDTKVEQTENGEFRTSSRGKAVNAYARSESQPVQSMFEYEA